MHVLTHESDNKEVALINRLCQRIHEKEGTLDEHLREAWELRKEVGNSGCARSRTTFLLMHFQSSVALSSASEENPESNAPDDVGRTIVHNADGESQISSGSMAEFTQTDRQASVFLRIPITFAAAVLLSSFLPPVFAQAPVNDIVSWPSGLVLLATILYVALGTPPNVLWEIEPATGGLPAHTISSPIYGHRAEDPILGYARMTCPHTGSSVGKGPVPIALHDIPTSRHNCHRKTVEPYLGRSLGPSQPRTFLTNLKSTPPTARDFLLFAAKDYHFVDRLPLCPRAGSPDFLPPFTGSPPRTYHFPSSLIWFAAHTLKALSVEWPGCTSKTNLDRIFSTSTHSSAIYPSAHRFPFLRSQRGEGRWSIKDVSTDEPYLGCNETVLQQLEPYVGTTEFGDLVFSSSINGPEALPFFIASLFGQIIICYFLSVATSAGVWTPVDLAN
ncbi:hypothetical protein BDZ97DRAFT_2062402 [Flammula alnicola]|nr:hypothetical protein BDZ97DRAFT_2062402 [Flammula alnicola]